MSLSSDDLAWFSQLTFRLHASRDERTLFDTITHGLYQRFDSIVTGVEEVAYNLSTHRLHRLAGGPLDLSAGQVAAFVDSPCVLRWQQRQASEVFHLHSLAATRDLDRTSFYNVICRGCGFEDQLISTFRSAPGTSVNISVNRDSLFTAREHLLMQQLHRHLLACTLRLRRTYPDFAGHLPPVLSLGADSRPLDYPPRIRRLLAAYFPLRRDEIARGGLPAEVGQWVRSSRALLSRRPPPHPLTVQRTESARGFLTLRFSPVRPATATTSILSKNCTSPIPASCAPSD